MVSDAASVTTEFPKGLFTATVSDTYLCHDTRYQLSYRIKKMFLHYKYLLFSTGFNVFTKFFCTKYESEY